MLLKQVNILRRRKKKDSGGSSSGLCLSVKRFLQPNQIAWNMYKDEKLEL